MDKETKINWKSNEKDIENMSIIQAIEILENHIKLGKSKGDFKPRKHMVKALEIAVEQLNNLLK